MDSTSISSIVLPSRKPLAIATAVSMFERHTRLTLSWAAIESLFQAGQVFSSGKTAGNHFYGKTSITVDLTKVAHRFVEPVSASLARDIVAYLCSDVRAKRKAKTVAQAEAKKLAGRDIRKIRVRQQIRPLGRVVQFDLVTEALIGEVVASATGNDVASDCLGDCSIGNSMEEK